MKKIMYIILNFSIVIIEIITYFVFTPEDIENFFFVWFIISLLIFIGTMKGSPFGTHTYTGNLISRNDTIKYLNLNTKTKIVTNREMREKISVNIKKNLFTIIMFLITSTNLITFLFI